MLCAAEPAHQPIMKIVLVPSDDALPRNLCHEDAYLNIAQARGFELRLID